MNDIYSITGIIQLFIFDKFINKVNQSIRKSTYYDIKKSKTNLYL